MSFAMLTDLKTMWTEFYQYLDIASSHTTARLHYQLITTKCCMKHHLSSLLDQVRMPVISSHGQLVTAPNHVTTSLLKYWGDITMDVPFHKYWGDMSPCPIGIDAPDSDNCSGVLS